MVLPSPTAIRKDLARRRLHHFVRQGWEAVEPETPLVWGQHIEAVCLHLEAVTRQQLYRPGDPEPDGGRIQKLLINIPPGHMKSLITSVFWPAWEWITAPQIRSLFASYALALATRDSVRCRDLITSGWYQEWFDPQWELKSDQNLKTWFANTAGGIRQCVSVESSATGFRAHKVVVDDPLNATDAYSEAMRTGANDWWFGTMSSRLSDPRTGARVAIMQRLHEEDLSGQIKARGGYEHLCLPSEFDPNSKCTTSIGWSDWRTEEGQLLFPEFFTPEVLAQARHDLGSAGYSAQHLQNPTPAGGLVFKRTWWRYWQPAGAKLPPVRVRDEDGRWQEIHAVDLPESFDETLQSWDMTFKDSKASDRVAGGVWGSLGPKAFLLDQECDRMSFTATLDAVRRVSAKWPEATRKLIEDKANGPAVINSLDGEIGGLVAVEPEGGKLARAHACTPLVEAGNVFVPHPLLYGWVDDYLDELTKFPLGAHDDQVDQTTQALRRLQAGGTYTWNF